ncbi:MAG: glycosyltransferase family 4 protein [Desulfotomaculales bacterium]
METWASGADMGGVFGVVRGGNTGRFLYVVTSGDTGGAQGHVLHCCTRFRGDYGVGLVAGTGGYLVERVRALGLPVYVLPGLGRNRPAAGDLSVLRGLLRVIRDFGPALVCCHSTKAGFLGRLAARLAGVPAVFTVHGWGFSEGVPAVRRAAVLRAERVAARWTDRIICVSVYDRDLALRHGVGQPEQMVVVPNGVPPVGEELRARPGEGGPVRLVMVARFEAPKDHLLLFRALSGLAAPDWELWLAGDGRLEEKARREAARLGLGDRVRFLGPRRDVPELLARCHVFVLTSHWEGLPLTVLEAMRAGLPVVASDVGGVREAVADGETGFLVPRGAVTRLRERLRLLLEDPALRARLGAAGYARWRERFTLDRMLRETEAVYREVLDRAGQKGPAPG